MAIKTVYLVVRADQSVRLLVRSYPRLRTDEVAWPIRLTFPNSGGSIMRDPIQVAVPELTPLEVSAGELELGSEQQQGGDDDND